MLTFEVRPSSMDYEITSMNCNGSKSYNISSDLPERNFDIASNLPIKLILGLSIHIIWNFIEQLLFVILLTEW